MKMCKWLNHISVWPTLIFGVNTILQSQNILSSSALGGRVCCIHSVNISIVFGVGWWQNLCIDGTGWNFQNSMETRHLIGKSYQFWITMFLSPAKKWTLAYTAKYLRKYPWTICGRSKLVEATLWAREMVSWYFLLCTYCGMDGNLDKFNMWVVKRSNYSSWILHLAPFSNCQQICNQHGSLWGFSCTSLSLSQPISAVITALSRYSG